MKRPEEISIVLNAERKLSEFVRWDGKPLYDFFIKVPTWISESYLKKRIGFVLVKFSLNKSINQIQKEENRETWQPYVRENWSSKLTKMRKINNGYMKIMPTLQPRAFFETHEGYVEYHKELKKLNEKYMKDSSDVQTKKGCGKPFKSPLPENKWDKCGDFVDGEVLLCNECSQNVHKANGDADKSNLPELGFEASPSSEASP